MKQCADQSSNQNLHDRFQGLRSVLVDEIQAAIDVQAVKPGSADRYASYLSSMIHGQMRSLTSGEMELDDVHPHEIMDIFLNGVSHA